MYSKVKNKFSAFAQHIAFGIVVSFKRHLDLIFSSKLTEKCGVTTWKTLEDQFNMADRGSVALIKSDRK